MPRNILCTQGTRIPKCWNKQFKLTRAGLKLTTRSSTSTGRWRAHQLTQKIGLLLDPVRVTDPRLTEDNWVEEGQNSWVPPAEYRIQINETKGPAARGLPTWGGSIKIKSKSLRNNGAKNGHSTWPASTETMLTIRSQISSKSSPQSMWT